SIPALLPYTTLFRSAYSPQTGLFYVPTNNMCMDYQTAPVTYLAGTPYMGVSAPYKPGPGGHLGAFIAWDAARGKKLWEIREPYRSEEHTSELPVTWP